jgi:hypothetical protein
MPDDQPGTGRRAADEAVAAAAYAAVMIVAGIILQVTQRKASDPDAVRDVKMRAAKAAERFCALSAARWWQWAERFRRAYEAERGGT